MSKQIWWTEKEMAIIKRVAPKQKQKKYIFNMNFLKGYCIYFWEETFLYNVFFKFEMFFSLCSGVEDERRDCGLYFEGSTFFT